MFGNARSLFLPLLAAILSISTARSVALAQAELHPTVDLAQARIRANDVEGAASILERLVVLEPNNGQAWRALGQTRQTRKDLDGAIRAWQSSLEVEPEVPTPYLSIGLAYASQLNLDRAFEWLTKARGTRKIDMSQLEVAPAVSSLKNDPRFPALLPTASDFAKPFVEPTQIIREWDGEASKDQFGWIARNLGDADGDGVADVVTSAPTKRLEGDAAGRIYVYSTKTGKLLWSADGRPGDQLGNGVENAGDVNRDGVNDVIAGAPGAGYAKVYSGRDGRVLLTLTAEDKGDQFGQHTSGAGDVDHDGFADVIVGAPGNNAGGAGAGRAYVYSGKTGKVLLTLTANARTTVSAARSRGFRTRQTPCSWSEPLGREPRAQDGFRSTADCLKSLASRSSLTRPEGRLEACFSRFRAISMATAFLTSMPPTGTTTRRARPRGASTSVPAGMENLFSPSPGKRGAMALALLPR